MNIPIELYVVGIILIAILLVFTIGVDHMIPMFVRASFDDVCNNYLAVIERDGGLDIGHKDALKAELNNLGITNIVINAPAAASWGEKATLVVEGEYNFQASEYKDLAKKNISKPIKYENSTIVLSNN